MIELRHHTLTETVWEGAGSVIYRGFRSDDRAPVMVKVPRSDFPTAREIAKIEHEYRVLSALDHPGVVKALGVSPVRRGVALILEDFGGRPLNAIIASGVISVERALTIGLSLAETLAAVHDQGVLHKDIKPHNVACNLETGDIKLIDFGISTRLEREAPRPRRLDAVEGTLAYISPEQTGRMNRDVDTRSDLYSLGVTLYEMLTGALPFTAGDAMELVHQHIARVPAPPHERSADVPEIVSSVVMKLLAKEAKDRYQHARGLAADLQSCLDAFRQGGAALPFALGQRDHGGLLRLPRQLHGREADAARLLAAFERAREGRPELVLVTGAAGVGKSALVHEVSRAAALRGGDFIAGKFDPIHRGAPFSSFVYAFRDLVRRLLSEPPAALAAWRAKLAAALGPNGRVVVDLLPHLEGVIGPQPAVGPLGPGEAEARLGLAFQRFVRAFCEPARPLVVFIDDLQWADPASLKLLKLLLTDPDGAHLLVVGAYRAHDVDEAHPLTAALQALRREGVEPIEIALGPLDLDAVRRVAGEALGAAADGRLDALAEQLLAKTHGNPFFLNQLLAAWHREGLLSIDRATGRFTWDDAVIAGTPVAANVVDLMIGALRELDPATQRLLSLAACIGHELDRATLSVVAGQPPADVAEALWPALQRGLLVPLDPDYPLVFPAQAEGAAEPGAPRDFHVRYRFLHDRVQQAAYALIAPEERQLVHLRIGRRLRATLPDARDAAALFEVVLHLNEGAARMTDPEERADLAALDLDAGRAAKARAAYATALDLLGAGVAAVSASGRDEARRDLSFALHMELAECTYLSGRFDEVDPALEALAPRATTARERASICSLRMMLYTSQGRFADAVAAGREGLALFGVELPRSAEALRAAFAAEMAEIDRRLEARTVESLLDAPPLTDEDQGTVVQMLARLSSPSYVAEPELSAVVIEKQLNLLLAHGASRTAGPACASYGLLLAGGLGRYADAVRFGRLSLGFVERFNASESVCRVNVLVGCFAPHGEPLRRALVTLSTAIESGLATGDMFWASSAVYWAAVTRFRLGAPLDVVSGDLERGLAVLRRTKDALATSFMTGLRKVVVTLSGRDLTPSGAELDPGAGDASGRIDVARQRVVAFGHDLFQLELCLLLEDRAGALAALASARRNAAVGVGIHLTTDLPFYGSLALTAAYAGASPDDQARSRDELAGYRATLEKLCAACPENELHRRALVDAEAARIAGAPLEAMDLYDRAIRLARENGFPHHEAMANELCARFHLESGRVTVARAYLVEARHGYERWGAAAKVRQLDERYPELPRPGAPRRHGFASTLDRSVATTSTLATTSDTVVLDVPSLIKASQALSGEISLERLTPRMMRVVAENAGAERGALVVDVDGELRVVAQMSIEDGVSVPAEPLAIEQCDGLSPGIVQYAARTRERVVLADAANAGVFVSDPYVARRRPKSVLCAPLLHQGQLRGVLYLENNLTTDAFDGDRAVLLGVLCAQMAISIDNAALYAGLERLVGERTRELREAQARLVQLEKQATEARMAGGFAHEMRNALAAAQIALSPVYSVEGDEVSCVCEDTGQKLTELLLLSQAHLAPAPLEKATELVASVYRNEKGVASALSGVHRNIDRSLRVTELILDYSRVGFERPGAARVSLRGVIDAVLREREADFAAIGVAVSVEGEADVALRGTEAHVHSIVNNLVANARDALAARGDGGERALRIALARRGGVAALEVSDTGIGIAAAHRAKIFEPFFSTKPATGTGLGLGVVQKLLLLYGGSIEVESEEGRGTTFRVRMPAPDA